MKTCFICKANLTNPYAVADVYKEPELRLNGGGRIRAALCPTCTSKPEVIKYKIVTITETEWKINPYAKKKVGEP